MAGAETMARNAPAETSPSLTYLATKVVFVCVCHNDYLFLF
ncbi:hypothetical protein MGCS36083_03886 [Streptococcus dysgalactiae subsp. equisimilis]|nr:hypothetical protein MGCS36083_03886 [Streptococcus dysgalactiae subsp. equisimilis]